MAKTLVLAEKPSVGRDIARVLGCKQRAQGCLIGDEYIVTWAIGHLVALASPEELDEAYKVWSFDTLPILPEHMKLIILPKVQRQFDIVSGLMNEPEVGDIICATDSGREGELIFRLIYQEAGCTKPVRRLWISSMTDEAIREGFDSLKPSQEYDNLFASARCRSEADWLVGMNGSRGFTLTYDTLLSVGRVQSPTLAIIVAREKERQAFVPEPYHEFWATFGRYKGRWFDPSKEENNHRIQDEATLARLTELAGRIKGLPAEVTELTREERVTKPPLLYDLTSLQREANRLFGWPAAKTLRVAQALYEKRKVITYPRTDSRYLSRDLYKTLKSRLAKLGERGRAPFVAQAQASDRQLFGRVINDARVSDHHAIIPTGRSGEGKGWTDDEYALFDLVARRYIAMFLPDEVAEYQRVVTVCEGESFESRGKRVLQPGWNAVYAAMETMPPPPAKAKRKKKGEEAVAEEKKKAPVKRKRKKEDEQDLPDLAVGDVKKVTSCRMAAKQTQPPPPYTEAMLLSAMENAGRFIDDEELREQMKDNGLGTPATRASIIERLLQVGYLRRRGKVLAPTEKGMKLIDVLPAPLRSPETTGRWEQGLAEIGRGEKDPDAFMADIRRFVVDIVDAARTKVDGVTFPPSGRAPGAPPTREPLGPCPLCGGQVLENSKAFYCDQWRRGCRLTIWKNGLEPDGGPLLTAPDITRLLTDKAVALEGGTAVMVKGKPFVAWQPAEGAPKPEGQTEAPSPDAPPQP